MFEGMFGPKKKKVVEAKDLPPQPEPYTTHDDDADIGNFRYDSNNHEFHPPLKTEEQADARYAEAQTFSEDQLPTPSQGSVEQVGMRRDAAHTASYERKVENRVPWKEDKSWKAQRDTPYRPEA